MEKNKVPLVIVIILTSLAAGLFGARLLMAKYPKLLCGKTCENRVTADRKFYADELIFFGETNPNEPFILYVDLNRKKVGNVYQHYYFADFIYQGRHRQLYTSSLENTEQIKPQDFLRSFSADMAEDLSSRENYSLDFVYNDLNITARVKDFKGDFLQKNTLEYTKYVSEQAGEVTINGKTYPVHAYLAKVYSGDYAKYIFFDGYDNLKSLAQFFVLWDEQGNFYVLDDSEVYTEVPDYKSHTWVLYKNKKLQTTKKAFYAKVNVDEAPAFPSAWSIDIPDFESRLELSPEIFFTDKKDAGLAKGTVVTPEDTSLLSGYFSFHWYGK